MDVQCPQCGQVQALDPALPNCMKCGFCLTEKDTTILQNPRRGRGMVGVGIIMFICFAALFLFYSKFVGGWGMAVSFLIYLWGLYKVDMNKRGGASGSVDQTKP